MHACSASSLIWYLFIRILVCLTAGSSMAIRETWHVASNADRSVSIECHRFERHPVVVMSFVAHLETVHAIFRHARSVYLSKSLDRLGWIVRRSWRAGRSINLLRHQPCGRSNVRFIELVFCENARRAGGKKRGKETHVRETKNPQTKTLYKKFPVIPVAQE